MKKSGIIKDPIELNTAIEEGRLECFNPLYFTWNLSTMDAKTFGRLPFSSVMQSLEQGFFRWKVEEEVSQQPMSKYHSQR